MTTPENMLAARRRFEEGLRRYAEVEDAPRTLRLEIGMLLRGQVRLNLARSTSLEVKEVKGFFESVFILTARNVKQYRELEMVQAWIRRIQEDGNE